MFSTDAEVASATSDLITQLPLVCNVADDVLYANMRAAMARELPLIDAVPPHDGVALLVGAGASLANDIEEIRGRQAGGATIFALNGVARYLWEQHGILADALVVLDARPHNVRFVCGLNWRTSCYLATQCAPALFENALSAGHDIVTWHAPMNGESGIREFRKTVLIGEGTSVGVRALRLVHVLGYREVHLFGYDSSYADGHSHAYHQPENDNDRTRECEADGQKFVSTAWMIRQAEDLQNLTVNLLSHGATIAVHGSGLFPTMAHAMVVENSEESPAVYDLGHAPASWDFLIWLVNAEMDRVRRGFEAPLKVAFKPGPKDGFRNDTLPVDSDHRWQLMEFVMRPALGLFGAGEVTEHEGRHYPYLMKDICDAARSGEPVPVIHPPQWALDEVDEALDWLKLKDPVVITLREARHWPERNSLLGAWLSFAAMLREQGENVIFVRDTERAKDVLATATTFPRASLDINIRAALYERAKCNLFTSSGPAVLGYFGTRPYLTFGQLRAGYPAGSPEWWAQNIGVPVGQQFPWAKPGQRLTWLDDTLPNLVAAWREFASMRQAA